MSNTGTIHIALKIDEKGSVRVLQDVGRVSADTGRKGKRAFDDMDRSAKSFTDSAKMSTDTLLKMGAGVGIVSVLVTQIQKLGSQSLQAASNLEEVGSKFSVVFAGQVMVMDKFTKELSKNYAMSTREAKEYLSSVQDLLVPMGLNSRAAAVLSKEVVKLSADLASFNNLPTAKVMEDIQAALVGEYQTMKKYGVVINEAIIKQEALNLGYSKTGKELTAAQKAQTAFALMLKSSEAAMGDQIRTAGSYANTTKSLNAEWETLTATLGQKFLPAATSVKSTLAGLFGMITEFLQGETTESLTDRLQEINAEIEKLSKESGPFESITLKARSEQATALRQKIGNLNEALKEASMFEGLIFVKKEQKEVLEETVTALNDIEKAARDTAISGDLDKFFKDVEAVEAQLIKNHQAVIDFYWEYEKIDYIEGMAPDPDEVAKYKKIMGDIVKSREDAQKRIEDANEKAQAAYEKMLDAARDDYKDFSGTVRDNLKDIIKSHDSMAQKIESIIEDMLYNIGAAIISQKFIIPIGLQVGSALGASWNGTPFSAMQSAGGMNAGSLLSSGNSIYNLATGGYSNMFTSGPISKVGSGIFGNANWFGTGATAPVLGGLPYYGAAEFMVPAAAGSVGSAGIASTLATVAPYAALAAIAIPLISSLFKNDPTPAIGIQMGSWDQEDAGHGSLNSSKFNYKLFAQDMGGETSATLRDYFDTRFALVDDTLSGALADTFKKYDAGAKNRGWVYTEGMDSEAILEAVSNNVFESILEGLKVESLGLGFDDFGIDFFKSIKGEGEDLFESFIHFNDVVVNTVNFLDDFDRQLELTNGDMTQAFLNLEKILDVFTGIDALMDPLTQINNPLVQTIDLFETYIDELKEANATLEDVTRAENKRTQAIGLQLSGLSAQNVGQSMLSAITTGTDIDTALNQIIGNSIASAMSVALTKEVMDDAILPFVDSIGQAFMDSGNDIEAVFAILPALMAGLDLSGNRAKIESFTEKWQAMFGGIEQTAVPYLAALQSELSALETKMNDAKSVYLDLLNDELSVQEDLSSALSSSIKSLQSFRATLWADNNASAGMADQRNMLSGRMSDLYNTALSGDAGAIEEFIAVSGQYLDVSKKMQTDWISYARDIAKTSSMLDGIETYAQDQLSEAQRQVLHLQGIIAEVTGVSNKLTDMDLARQAYESAKFEFDTSWMNDEIALLQGILTSSQTLESLMATFQKAQGGMGDKTNSGATSAAIEAAYLAANPDVAAEVAAGKFTSGKQHYEMWGQYESRGLEGYAGQSAEGKYLNAYPDVAKAVQRGEFASGMSHYLQHGIKENRQFADGGILSGPKSGYPVNATFHGIEAVIPLNSGNIPVRIIDDSRGETTEEIRLLRTDIAAYGSAVVRHTSDIARLIDLWETFGPPAVRETVS